MVVCLLSQNTKTAIYAQLTGCECVEGTVSLDVCNEHRRIVQHYYLSSYCQRVCDSFKPRDFLAIGEDVAGYYCVHPCDCVGLSLPLNLFQSEIEGRRFCCWRVFFRYGISPPNYESLRCVLLDVMMHRQNRVGV